MVKDCFFFSGKFEDLAHSVGGDIFVLDDKTIYIQVRGICTFCMNELHLLLTKCFRSAIKSTCKQDYVNPDHSRQQCAFLEETKGDGLAGLRPASCGLLWDWWLTGNKLKLPNQTKPNSRNQTN